VKAQFLEALNLITHPNGIAIGVQNDPRYKIDRKLEPTRENVKILLSVAKGLLDRQNANGDATHGGGDRQPYHHWLHRLEMLTKELESASADAWTDHAQLERERIADQVIAERAKKAAAEAANQKIVDDARARERAEDAKRQPPKGAA
jgi:hypothetical protein